ncbi:HNH endonuclease [Pseudarthrobacter sp. NPDC058329]|uniref:HNH endonuclease signature motif containing protein n=1 Tax=Pseudarthrobacter sp. NPDC058329 TaxID=3346448 RepID=UPI0036DF2A35
MGNGGGAPAAMEGIHASVAGLDVLFLEEAALDSCAGDGADVDVLQRQYEIRLERMTAVKQLEAQLAAVKARDAAEALDIQHAITPPDAPVHERTYAEMSAIEEIAGVLTISSGTAGAFISQSRQLCALPLAMDALCTGTITWQHARIIADETESLDPAGAKALAAHFFDPDAPNPARGAAPGELVPARFRAKVRTWRERHHPETLEKRHTKSAADRRMEYTPDRDGMAWISLHLPGDTACAIWNRTTALARGLQSPNEPRTMTQLRPDIAARLLLSAPAAAGSAGTGTGDGVGDTATGATAARNNPERDNAEGDSAERATANGAPANDGIATLGQVPVPKVDVLVTVPVFALLGLTDEPALLDGYGPIPASMARKLVADGASSFYRVLVDPRDGAPLEIGRTNYRITKAMKKALHLRDGKCTFPGCNNNSLDNEADHLKAWQHGGTTGISNLAQLCPKHHRLKHNSGWKPTPATRNEPPGWTSPTGRHYKAEHHHWEPPHWPNQIGLERGMQRGNVLPSHPPDFAYIGLSPGEEGLERFLHARGG